MIKDIGRVLRHSEDSRIKNEKAHSNQAQGPIFDAHIDHWCETLIGGLPKQTEPPYLGLKDLYCKSLFCTLNKKLITEGAFCYELRSCPSFFYEQVNVKCSWPL